MPFGYVTSMGLLAVCTSCALWPRVPAQSQLRSATFWFGFLVNELPFLGTFVVVASTALAAAQGDLVTPLGLVGAAIGVATLVGLAVVAIRALPARGGDGRGGAGWRCPARGAAVDPHRLVAVPVPELERAA